MFACVEPPSGAFAGADGAGEGLDGFCDARTLGGESVNKGARCDGFGVHLGVLQLGRVRACVHAVSVGMHLLMEDLQVEVGEGDCVFFAFAQFCCNGLREVQEVCATQPRLRFNGEGVKGDVVQAVEKFCMHGLGGPVGECAE